VVRFVPAANRVAVNYFAVVFRPGFDIDDHKLVRGVSDTLGPERPDVHEFLLPLDAGEVWRRTCFVRADV